MKNVIKPKHLHPKNCASNILSREALLSFSSIDNLIGTNGEKLTIHYRVTH